MKLLRTTSTRRLLAGLTGLLVAALAGTAIAIAASGNGPKPTPKPLARAVHDALAAPAVAGITARITFTNHLIDASNIEGTDPLLTGGSGRLWVSPGHGLRIELQSDNGDSQIVINKTMFWAYDATSSTVYEGHIPADSSKTSSKPASHDGLPSIAEIQSVLTRLGSHASVSGAVPSDVAGHPAYTVTVSPRADGGLVGGASLAFDAARGVPLRFAIFARGDSAPVLELKATNISYGSVAASVFSLHPPAGAKVVNVDVPTSTGKASDSAASDKGKAKGKRQDTTVAGVRAVQSHLSFPLGAPAAVAGMSRSSVTLMGKGAHAGAMVVYGQGLGGIYVIERPGATKLPSSSASGDQRGLSLPTVSINGASAQELATPLGTVLRFSRSGVSYTLFGSVTSATAERAARSL
jgi:outer membrane lipoprotein-sorting protein